MPSRGWRNQISQWPRTLLSWGSSATRGHIWSYSPLWKWYSPRAFWAMPSCSSWSSQIPGSTHPCTFCSANSPCWMLAFHWSPSPRWQPTFCRKRVLSPLGVVQLRCFSSCCWVSLKVSCYPSCLMTATLLCATPCITPCSWDTKSACSWWALPGCQVCLWPPSRPPLPCTFPIVPHELWITSSVNCPLCWSSLVLTPLRMSWHCPSPGFWSCFCPCPSLPPLTATCWGPCSACTQLRPDTKPSPPAPLISLWWCSFMGQLCSCIWCQEPTTAHSRTTWSPSSTVSSPPPSTPSSIAWGTEKLEWLWSKFLAELVSDQRKDIIGDARLIQKPSLTAFICGPSHSRLSVTSSLPSSRLIFFSLVDL